LGLPGKRIGREGREGRGNRGEGVQRGRGKGRERYWPK